MPARASVDCDCRLLPGDSEGDLLGELAEALGDDVPHEIEIIDATLTGGSISPAESPLFEFCRDFFAANDPAAVVVPTILNGPTQDSHPMREAFGTVAYGVWPVRTHPYEVVAAGVHGADERIHVDDLGDCDPVPHRGLPRDRCAALNRIRPARAASGARIPRR